VQISVRFERHDDSAEVRGFDVALFRAAFTDPIVHHSMIEVSPQTSGRFDGNPRAEIAQISGWRLNGDLPDQMPRLSWRRGHEPSGCLIEEM